MMTYRASTASRHVAKLRSHSASRNGSGPPTRTAALLMPVDPRFDDRGPVVRVEAGAFVVLAVVVANAAPPPEAVRPILALVGRHADVRAGGLRLVAGGPASVEVGRLAVLGHLGKVLLPHLLVVHVERDGVPLAELVGDDGRNVRF